MIGRSKDAGDVRAIRLKHDQVELPDGAEITGAILQPCCQSPNLDGWGRSKALPVASNSGNSEIDFIRKS